MEILSNAVIMSSLLDEISVGLTSPKKVKKNIFKNLLKRARVIVAKKIQLCMYFTSEPLLHLQADSTLCPKLHLCCRSKSTLHQS